MEETKQKETNGLRVSRCSVIGWLIPIQTLYMSKGKKFVNLYSVLMARPHPVIEDENCKHQLFSHSLFLKYSCTHQRMCTLLSYHIN